MKPTTPHDSLDDLIAAALHGDLTPEERAQFESRLQSDPNAQAAYQEAQAMHDLLEKTNKSAQPDPNFEQRMVSGVRRKIANPPHQETAWESLLVLGKAVTGVLRLPGRLLGGASIWTYSGVASLLIVVVFAFLINQGNQVKSVFTTITSQLSVASDSNSYAVAAQRKDLQSQMDSLKSRQAEPRDLQKALKEDGVADSSTTSNLTLSGKVAPSDDSTIMNGNTAISGGKTLVDANAPGISGQNVVVASSDVPATPPSAMPSAFNAAPDAASTVPASTAAPTTPAQTHAAFAIDDLKQQEQAQATAKKIADRQPRAVIDSDTATTVASLEKPATQKPTAPNPAATPAPAAVDFRKLIRNAQLDLEVKSYQAAFDQVTALTRAAGGYVDTSNSQRGGNGKLQGILVVKIQPGSLDAFLLKLHDLGDVQNQSVSTDDVTKEYFDTQARLGNSQKMEVQLQELLKRENGKVSDLLAVERELGRVRGEIESMQGQLKLYDFQVQYATVTMNVAEKDLNQTAAYLLKEQDDFALFATDVEATFQKARTAADDFKTQVLVANLQHNSGTDVSAELTVMVPPDDVEHFLTTIRGLGRVSNFTRQTQRVAKDGGDSAQPADQTRTDKDKVQVHLVIKSDDDTRKQVAVIIVAKQVDDALDMAKAATLANTGAEILGSTLNTTPDGVSKAQLNVRVPGKEYATLMDAFRALGRQASLNVQRNDNSGPGATGDDVPVIVSLSLTDKEIPVQATNLVLVTPKVDEMTQQIKKDAAAAGAEVKASNFGGQPNGSHLGRLTLLLPMGKYPAYIETLKKLGRVQSLSVQRNDTSGNASDDAPAEIVLALTDDDPPVQVTQITLVAGEVDTQAQQIKKQAADAGVDIKSSSFQRQPDGTELAQMTLRLPLGHYPAFLTALQQAGKTESLSVQRDDHPEQARPDDSAPAEIQLQIHNTPTIVPDNGGLWPTLRDTFAQGFGALFGSIKVIGVIVAFLIPWAVAIILAAWIGRRIYLWRKNR